MGLAEQDRFGWVVNLSNRCDRGIFDHSSQGGRRGTNAV